MDCISTSIVPTASILPVNLFAKIHYFPLIGLPFPCAFCDPRFDIIKLNALPVPICSALKA